MSVSQRHLDPQVHWTSLLPFPSLPYSPLINLFLHLPLSLISLTGILGVNGEPTLLELPYPQLK